MSEKVTDAGIIENRRVYVQDEIQIHTMLRDIFLKKKEGGDLDYLR